MTTAIPEAPDFRDPEALDQTSEIDAAGTGLRVGNAARLDHRALERLDRRHIGSLGTAFDANAENGVGEHRPRRGLHDSALDQDIH